jgi:hypothetical protein
MLKYDLFEVMKLGGWPPSAPCICACVCVNILVIDIIILKFK